jgi:peptidoglycan-N-acetylglucosamine deacetylase
MSSTASEPSVTGWGPDGRRGAVSFTFDNLGEASDIEFGKWPHDQPIGSHMSVTQVVPELLERLRGIQATFFVEAWNATVYPGALRAMADAGHQVALHGLRHELWAPLDSQRQVEVLERSLEAMATAGLRPIGFRPPGGYGSDNLPELMRRYGFTHFSCVGEGSSNIAVEGVVSMPFTWPFVDGNQLEERIGARWNIKPGADGQFGPPLLRQVFTGEIDRAAQAGVHVVFDFHPWIIGQNRERMEAMFSIVAHARSRPDIWVASCREVADWMLVQKPMACADIPGRKPR